MLFHVFIAVAGAAPTLSSISANPVTTTEARLNVAVNAGGANTTVWFRWKPGALTACDDTFGFRVPPSGGTSVAAAQTNFSVAEQLAGLAAGSEYSFCALGSNDAGTTLGGPVSFITGAGAPSVTTNAPSDVTPMSATLNGSANPRGGSGAGWFRWSATEPQDCDDLFGTRVPATGGTELDGGNGDIAFSEPITGLMPSTPYYYCALAQTGQGVALGTVLTFTTSSPAPVVTTEDATQVGVSAGTLNGTVNPIGQTGLAWFRWGKTQPATCDDAFGTRAPTNTGIPVAAGSAAMPITTPLSGLEARTKYWYCAAASTAGGVRFGSLRAFTTGGAPPPEVVTFEAQVGQTTVTLKGTVNPNGAPTTAWFRHSTSSGQCEDAFGTRAPATGEEVGSGTAALQFTEALSELPEGTSYYCAIAANDAGTVYGAVKSFVVPKKMTEEPTPPKQGCGVALGVPLVLGAVVFALRRRRARVSRA